MNLNKQQWYVRWFFTCLAVIDEFAGDHGDRVYKNRHGASLCPFVRVSLIWGPLIILLHLVVYAGAIVSVTLLPIILFGFGSYITLIAGITGVIAVIWLCKKAEDALKQWRRRVREARWQAAIEAPESDEQPKTEAVKKGPSFASVLWSYAVAAKQRVCPIINFNS